MGVEIYPVFLSLLKKIVMPREGHGSRNTQELATAKAKGVMPREGHGSRNTSDKALFINEICHAPRGAWE